MGGGHPSSPWLTGDIRQALGISPRPFRSLEREPDWRAGAGAVAAPPLALELRARLTPGVFQRAWLRVRTPGGAGCDGEDASAFALNLHRNLAMVRRLVLAGAWRPRRLLRRRISKSDGGERLLGIPTLRDRLVQAAVLEVADPALDGLLMPWVFGYRRGRTVAGAVGHLISETGRRPHLEMVKADVEALFDNLDHRLLEQHVRSLSADPLWLGLNRRWMRAWATTPGRGVPQGAPLSPLLANLYMHHALDLPLEGSGARVPAGPGPLVGRLRYGDDLVLVSPQPGGAAKALGWLRGVLARAGLRLASSKTTSTSAGVQVIPLVVLGEPLVISRCGGGWTMERRPDALKALQGLPLAHGGLAASCGVQ